MEDKTRPFRMAQLHIWCHKNKFLPEDIEGDTASRVVSEHFPEYTTNGALRRDVLENMPDEMQDLIRWKTPGGGE